MAFEIVDRDLLPGFTVEWESTAPQVTYHHGWRRIFARDEADARHNGQHLIARDIGYSPSSIRILGVTPQAAR